MRAVITFKGVEGHFLFFAKLLVIDIERSALAESDVDFNILVRILNAFNRIFNNIHLKRSVF